MSTQTTDNQTAMHSDDESETQSETHNESKTEIYIRKCERYTVQRASEPLKIHVDNLRLCEPPYQGTTNQELLEYLNEHVFDNEEWYDINRGVYPNSEITGEDLYIETEYFDSREKGADEWMELGVPNNQWVKTGQFEILESNHY